MYVFKLLYHTVIFRSSIAFEHSIHIYQIQSISKRHDNFIKINYDFRYSEWWIFRRLMSLPQHLNLSRACAQFEQCVLNSVAKRFFIPQTKSATGILSKAESTCCCCWCYDWLSLFLVCFVSSPYGRQTTGCQYFYSKLITSRGNMHKNSDNWSPVSTRGCVAYNCKHKYITTNIVDVLPSNQIEIKKMAIIYGQTLTRTPDSLQIQHGSEWLCWNVGVLRNKSDLSTATAAYVHI